MYQMLQFHDALLLFSTSLHLDSSATSDPNPSNKQVQEVCFEFEEI
ncbi:hypothetical protein V6Z11_D11G088800 [Gossypium hirsutum]